MTSSATSSSTSPVFGRKGIELTMAESKSFSVTANHATASMATRPFTICRMLSPVSTHGHRKQMEKERELEGDAGAQ